MAIDEGTLYPLLRRLETQGLLVSEWREEEKRIKRFYRLSPLWGIALPAITFLFMLYTLDSAYQYAAGKGGIWKGRVQAKAHDHGG